MSLLDPELPILCSYPWWGMAQEEHRGKGLQSQQRSSLKLRVERLAIVRPLALNT